MRVAAPKSVATQIGVAVPELMVLPLSETPDGTLAADALPLIEAQYKPCAAAIIGPALDDHEATNELCRQLIARVPLPAVIDAQALLASAAPPTEHPTMTETLRSCAGEIPSGRLKPATLVRRAVSLRWII